MLQGTTPWVYWLSLAGTLLLGCGSDADDPAAVCDPGATQECLCPDTASGAQVCDADGQGWGECACGASDSTDATSGVETADGADGTPGDGADATDGADARDGSDGADARDGSDASVGGDGSDGADGTDGADATDGTDGGDGTDGADGTGGMDGGGALNSTPCAVDSDCDDVCPANAVLGCACNTALAMPACRRKCSAEEGCPGAASTCSDAGLCAPPGEGMDGTDGTGAMDGTDGTDASDGTDATDGTDGAGALNETPCAQDSDCDAVCPGNAPLGCACDIQLEAPMCRRKCEGDSDCPGPAVTCAEYGLCLPPSGDGMDGGGAG